jgi:hypothetical protein
VKKKPLPSLIDAGSGRILTEGIYKGSARAHEGGGNMILLGVRFWSDDPDAGVVVALLWDGEHCCLALMRSALPPAGRRAW